MVTCQRRTKSPDRGSRVPSGSLLLVKRAQWSSCGHDDLAAGAPVPEVADRIGHFVERERSIDDRRDHTGIQQLPELLQVLTALLGDEEAELLADEG